MSKLPAKQVAKQVAKTVAKTPVSPPAKQASMQVAKTAAPQPEDKPASVLNLVSGLNHYEHELVQQHPMYPVVVAAIVQAMWGKGERHGGDLTPFTDQPWAHYARMHGRGFLTGQAAKKLEEAASTRSGQAFEQEVLGAMVYLSMAVLAERGLVGKVDRGGAV